MHYWKSTTKGVEVYNKERFFDVLQISLVFLCLAGVLIDYLYDEEFGIATVICISLLLPLLKIRLVTTIDCRGLRIRQGFVIFGKQFGRWKPINSIDYISIYTSLGVNDTVSPMMIPSLTFLEKELKVNLIYNRNKRLQLFEKLSLEESKNLGLDIGKQLKIGVLDSTTKQQVWLYKPNFNLNS